MKTINLPITLAITWILLMLTVFYFEIEHIIRVGVFSNLLFILMITIGVIYQKVEQERKLDGYGDNFKLCLKNSAIYIIIVTIYAFSYFKYINPSYLQEKKRIRIEQTVASLPENESEYKNAMQGKTREEIVKEIEGTFAIFGSVSLHTSITFLFLFVMSMFYSILSPILYKKIVLRM